MTERINLTELRAQQPEEIILTQHHDPTRERDPEGDYLVAVLVPPETLHALIDLAEAAQEVDRRERRSEYTSIYAAPAEFARILRPALARFQDSPPK